MGLRMTALMEGFEILWMREEYEEPVTLYPHSARKRE